MQLLLSLPHHISGHIDTFTLTVDAQVQFIRREISVERGG
jgi:hypothetical protein